MKQEILLIGTDARFSSLTELLHRSGWKTRCHQVFQHPDDFFPASSFEDIAAVILPLPSLTAEGFIRGTDAPAIHWEQLLRAVPDSIPILGGLLPEPNGSLTADLLKDEIFAQENAALTAEGAIQILMNRIAPLQGKRVLLAGFGRIGSLLAPKLHALGMEVSIFVRRPEIRTKCRLSGFGIHSGSLSGYDCILNTIPAPVFSESELMQRKPDCLLLELAGAPGGFPPDGAANSVVKASGIPASYAPEAAAMAEFDAIARFLKGRVQP